MNYVAAECKIMFDKMTEEKPKPLPEVPKVKPHSISTRDRRSVKSIKTKEEPLTKPQIEEKPLPPKTDNFKTFTFEYTTPPTTNEISSEKSYSSGYSSIGTPGYNNGTYPYSYSNRYKLILIVISVILKYLFILLLILRYSCNAPPPMPKNHWWSESSPAAPPLPSTPAPVPPPKVDSDAQLKLDLDTRIEMLLSGISSQGASVEPAFLSIVKKDSDDVSNIVEDVMDNDLDINLPPPPGTNDNHSDLDEEKNSFEEETLPPLSNPPSPFLSEDIYIKCFEKAAEQLKITKEKEKLEAKSFLNKSIRNGK